MTLTDTTPIARNKAHPTLLLWLVVGWVGFALLPWYTLDEGIFSFEWLVGGYPFDDDYAPALFLGLQGLKLFRFLEVSEQGPPQWWKMYR